MSGRLCLFVARTAQLVMVAVLILVLVPAAQSGPAQPQNGTNLLTNGDFEGSFDAEGLAVGWSGWGKDDSTHSPPNFEPGSPGYLGSSHAQKASWSGAAFKSMSMLCLPI